MFYISDQANGKKSYALIGVILLVVLLPLLWYYSFNPQGFGLLPIFEILVNISFFLVGLGSSLVVMMRKDLGAKRALVIIGTVVFLVSTFALYNRVFYLVDRRSYYSLELIIVNVFFTIAGARLLISGLYYVVKWGTGV